MSAVALGGIGLHIGDHVARIDPRYADFLHERADLAESVDLVALTRGRLHSMLDRLDELGRDDEHQDRPATNRGDDFAQQRALQVETRVGIPRRGTGQQRIVHQPDDVQIAQPRLRDGPCEPSA